MTLIEIGLTVAGFVILGAGYLEARKLRKQLETGSIKQSWDILSVFIAVFMVGYAGYIAKLALNTALINAQMLTSSVFFLGSVFVAMTSYYNRKAFTSF
ncbi:MAG: hypothetical protein ABEK04_05710 [Candidatus Nanohalobium sp.]